jgi:uncharacterized protein (DUF488 family)
MTVYTIGHSTRSLDELVAILQEAEVELLVDVRAFPRSRRNPQFNAEALPGALDAARIGTRHLGALGGRRGARKLESPSPNGLWREAAFRNYADYALTPGFRTGLETLKALAGAQCCAVMCAEADWRNCHRRFVADYLLAAGLEVVHLLDLGRREAARITPGAEAQGDGGLHYPARQGSLF